MREKYNFEKNLDKSRETVRKRLPAHMALLYKGPILPVNDLYANSMYITTEVLTKSKEYKVSSMMEELVPRLNKGFPISEITTLWDYGDCSISYIQKWVQLANYDNQLLIEDTVIELILPFQNRIREVFNLKEAEVAALTDIFVLGRAYQDHQFTYKKKIEEFSDKNNELYTPDVKSRYKLTTARNSLKPFLLDIYELFHKTHRTKEGTSISNIPQLIVQRKHGESTQAWQVRVKEASLECSNGHQEKQKVRMAQYSTLSKEQRQDELDTLKSVKQKKVEKKELEDVKATQEKITQRVPGENIDSMIKTYSRHDILADGVLKTFKKRVYDMVDIVFHELDKQGNKIVPEELYNKLATELSAVDKKLNKEKYVKLFEEEYKGKDFNEKSPIEIKELLSKTMTKYVIKLVEDYRKSKKS